MWLSARERRAVLVVGGAFGAAFVSAPLAMWVAGVLAAVAALSFRPRVVVIALLVLVSARAHHEIGALQPLDTRPVDDELVQLVADPRPNDSTWRAIARLEQGPVVMVEARFASGGVLARASAGDSLRLSGVLKGSAPGSGWALSRRLVGRIEAESVALVSPAHGPVGWATRFREMLRDGAGSLTRDRQSLFTGLVFGDDREQSVITADSFRAAGLGHLLAVSGQNVVFVVGLAAPLLLRIRSLNLRYAAFLVVLVAFGFVTRFEPSVTRALTMAALVGFAANRGSPRQAIDVIPVAVVGLLLIDPLLGFALGFQLSVLATLGLMIISPRLFELMPGPAALRMAVSATAGAQLAVSPLLLLSFGRVSVLAIPANLLAGPAAAFVMMWGLTGGLLAALAPPSLAVGLHWPTNIAVAWIETVASTTADIPAAAFGWWNLVALFGALLVRRAQPVLATLLVIVAVVGPIAFPPSLGVGTHDLAPGLQVTRVESGLDIVQLSRRGGASTVIEELRHANVGRIDLLVVQDGSRQAGRLVRTISTRFEVAEIWAPPNHNIPGARIVGDDPAAILERAMASSSHGESAR